MKSTIRNFFSEGDTSYGFYSFYPYVINEDIKEKKCYHIHEGTDNEKSLLLSKVGDFFIKKGYDIEYYHCFYDDSLISSIIIKDLNLRIINDTNTFKINKKIKNTFQRAYKFIEAAKLINYDWYNFNRKALNCSKLLLIEDDLRNRIFKNCSSENMGSKKHLYATSFTSNGIITYIENLVENYTNIYVLNGGPGTGKNEILKKIYKEALYKGFFVEIYSNPLIPEKLEHIILPELNTAIITSNEINKMNFPGIQIYMENLLDYSEIHKEELAETKKIFYYLLNKALSIMSSAKQFNSYIEDNHDYSINFENTDKTYEYLLNKIFNI